MDVVDACAERGNNGPIADGAKNYSSDRSAFSDRFGHGGRTGSLARRTSRAPFCGSVKETTARRFVRLRDPKFSGAGSAPVRGPIPCTGQQGMDEAVEGNESRGQLQL